MLDVVVVGKAVGALALLGIAGGGALASASKRLPVEPDHRVEAVLSELPGANCGGCGMPSCFGTAVAMTAGRLPVDACVFGGRRVADAVSRVLDSEARERTGFVGALKRRVPRRVRV